MARDGLQWHPLLRETIERDVYEVAWTLTENQYFGNGLS
jgi:hypothetical protein